MPKTNIGAKSSGEPGKVTEIVSNLETKFQRVIERLNYLEDKIQKKIENADTLLGRYQEYELGNRELEKKNKKFF